MIGGADGIPMALHDQLEGALAELERNLEIGLKALEGAKAEMDAAVAAEREACALIADQLGCCGQETARKIRARK